MGPWKGLRRLTRKLHAERKRGGNRVNKFDTTFDGATFKGIVVTSGSISSCLRLPAAVLFPYFVCRLVERESLRKTNENTPYCERL